MKYGNAYCDRNLNNGPETKVGLAAKRHVIWRVYCRRKKVDQEREKEKLVNEVAIGPM